jgi:hypothetical protein
MLLAGGGQEAVVVKTPTPTATVSATPMVSTEMPAVMSDVQPNFTKPIVLGAFLLVLVIFYFVMRWRRK